MKLKGLKKAKVQMKVTVMRVKMRRLIQGAGMEEVVVFTFADHEHATNRNHKVFKCWIISREKSKMATRHWGCNWVTST